MKKNALLFFVFLLVAALFAQTAWAQAGRRYALVIGNADYQRIEKLRNTRNDAEDVGAALRDMGFEVDVKFDLGQLQMVDAVDAFISRLSSNRANEGFFWYAGHAVQIRDENYLLPVDVTVDSESRVRAGSYSLNSLIESLGNAHNKVNVLILDSCRDNPLPPSGRSAGAARGLSVIRDVPSDLFVMFSTAPGDKADDGAAGKRNSPFAEAFLKYMRALEPVTIMVTDVANETMSLTEGRQRPYMTGSIISEKYYSLNPATLSAITVNPVQPVPVPSQPSVLTATTIDGMPALVWQARRDCPSNTLVGIGSAKLATTNQSKTTAEIRARAEIVRAMDTMVMQMVEDYTASSEVDPSVAVAFQQNYTIALSKAQLSGAVVVAETVDGDGAWWTVVYFSKENVSREINQAQAAAKLAVPEMLPFNAEARINEAFERVR